MAIHHKKAKIHNGENGGADGGERVRGGGEISTPHLSVDYPDSQLDKDNLMMMVPNEPEQLFESKLCTHPSN